MSNVACCVARWLAVGVATEERRFSPSLCTVECDYRQVVNKFAFVAKQYNLVLVEGR